MKELADDTRPGALALSLGAGLSVAFAEFAISLLGAVPDFVHPLDAAAPLLCSALLFAGLYFGASWLCRALQARGGDPNPSAFAIPLLLALALAAGVTNALGFRASAPQQVAAIAFSVWAVVPIYLLGRTHPLPPGRVAAYLSSGLPAVAAIALTATALGTCVLESTLSRLGLLALSVGAALGALRLTRVLGRGSGPGRLALWIPALATYTLLAAASLVARHTADRSFPVAAAGPAHPPVILITTDTLRADALPVYREGAPATPAIQALAAEAVVFEAARSPAPWTKPAMTSLFTGLSPLVHRATGLRDRLPDEVTTLAEHFRAAGYRTAAVGSNAFLGRSFNFHQGFDEYLFFPRGSAADSWGARALAFLFGARHAKFATTEDLTDLAIQWLRGHRDDPFFLWLHYLDPHLPYEAPPEFLPTGEAPARIGRSFNGLTEIRTGRFVPTPQEWDWIRALYQAEVRYVDSQLARFLSELERLGLYDEAVIAFTSDHGEEFGEHGGYEHGHSVHDEVLRVPLIVRWPGGAKRGRVERSVATTAVAATLLEAAGLKLPTHAAAPLSGALEDSDAPKRAPLVATGLLYFEDRHALVVDGYKYVRMASSGAERLYDLERDPFERVSVLDEGARQTREARELLARTLAESEAIRSAVGLQTETPADLDASTRDELRALGYIE